MISNSLHDLNPQVRWAAVSVFRMLSINLGPTLQVQYHHKMLPALTAMIADFHFPHLQERAALEIRLFSKDCIRNDLKPHLEEIVSKLLALLQNENQQLQEEAMATLASIAISSQV
ncbi:uncharacterized protein LOC133860505 [Alnus glutinosa]|uniref:uncharacterized protein LOC133860505 n=1 Tax=Alnus glutinosa TaxID=3517 RepID=UPI002D7873D4|nr:uncharacterized protein LOC133860505 [Alnus glutinosa]